MHTAISVARTCGIIRPQDQVAIVHADEGSVRLDPVNSEALSATNGAQVS